MKFKDKQTGNILNTNNAKAIELMQGKPERYEQIATRTKAPKTEENN